MWNLTRSDTNQAVQQLEMARGLKFVFRKKRDSTIKVAKTKVMISFAVTCIFVFAYAERWFSHDAAHLLGRLPCVLSARDEVSLKDTNKKHLYETLFIQSRIRMSKGVSSFDKEQKLKINKKH